jgi:hypothetical protein
MAPNKSSRQEGIRVHRARPRKRRPDKGAALSSPESSGANQAQINLPAVHRANFHSDRIETFEEWIEAARRVTVHQELLRRGLWSRAMAGDHGVPCPGCGGHDRFAVNLRKNVWVCRASGEGGDAIALARHIDGTDCLEAVETIIGYPSPDRASRLTETQRRAIVAHAEKTAQETEAKRCEAEESSQHFRERERRKAWQTWSEGAPFAGTPAEDYLALRGLHTSGGARLRFHPSLPFWDKPNFHGGAIVHQGPALVAAIEGPDGHFAGVHRTWIDLSKPKGKAIITDPETGEILPSKKVRGSIKGGSILLVGGGVEADFPGDRRDAQTLFLGEGLETVLAVSNFLESRPSRFPHWHGAEFRSGVSLGNISGRAAGRVRHPTQTLTDKLGRVRPHFVSDNAPRADDNFPMINLPESVRELVLLGDGDSEPFFTRMALERAGKRFASTYPRLLIRLAMAAPGQDFNDMFSLRAALS